MQHVVGTRIGLALAVAAAAVALGACGDSSDETSDDSGAKKVTLKVWDVQYFPDQKGSAGALGRALKEIDEAFMKKYPNVTIEHTGVPGAQFMPGMQTFVASRKGPDVVTNGGGTFPVTSGFAKALRPMYDLITDQQREELGPYLAGESIGDEANYSIPTQAHVYQFYYNKAMFEKAGIQAPPVTFDELLSACDALKEAGITPITNKWTGTAGNLPWNYGVGSQILDAQGLTDWAYRRIGWDDERIKAGLGYLQQMAERGCFGDRKTAATGTDTDGVSAFQGGRGAMLFWNVLDTSTFGKPVGGIENVGVFAFPQVPNSAYPPGTPDSGYNANWSMMNYTKHCKVAWDFIAFSISKEAQEIMWRVGKTLPVNQQVDVEGANPVEDAILDLAANKDGHTGIGATTSGEEATLQERLLPLLINGSTSPEEMASQMQDQRDRVGPFEDAELPKPSPCT